MGIGDLIVYHEPGIERQLMAAFLHRYGVRMAADAVVFFEEGDVEVAMQKMRARKA